MTSEVAEKIFGRVQRGWQKEAHRWGKTSRGVKTRPEGGPPLMMMMMGSLGEHRSTIEIIVLYFFLSGRR